MLSRRLTLDHDTVTGLPMARHKRKPASKIARVPGGDPADASSATPDGLGLAHQSGETLCRFERRFDRLGRPPGPPSSAGVGHHRG